MVDTSGAPATVETLIFDRLTEADLPGPVADIVVAALLGDDDLDAALGPQGWQRPSMPQDHARRRRPEVFSAVGCRLRDSAVSERRPRFAWNPGPGLTLVVGRNGSGKSSFAEAAELAVTGESRRWSHNTAARTGWRNRPHQRDITGRRRPGRGRPGRNDDIGTGMGARRCVGRRYPLISRNQVPAANPASRPAGQSHWSYTGHSCRTPSLGRWLMANPARCTTLSRPSWVSTS